MKQLTAILFALTLLWSTPAVAQDFTPLEEGQHEADEPPVTPLEQRACCKTCKKGKACGDSCISRKKKCTKPKGCACNG